MDWQEIGIFVEQKTGLEFVVKRRDRELLHGEHVDKARKGFSIGQTYETPKHEFVVNESEYQTNCGLNLDVSQLNPLVLKFKDSEGYLVSKID